jgi:hypothetical protein
MGWRAVVKYKIKISLIDPYQNRTDIYSLKGNCTHHYTKRPYIIIYLYILF